MSPHREQKKKKQRGDHYTDPDGVTETCGEQTIKLKQLKVKCLLPSQSTDGLTD